MIGNDALLWATKSENLGIVIVISILIIVLAWLKGQTAMILIENVRGSIRENIRHIAKFSGLVITLYFVFGWVESLSTIEFIAALISAIIIYSKFSNSVRSQARDIMDGETI